MKYFTKEENKPSKNTLNIIKQIAYTYRSIKLNGKKRSLLSELETYHLWQH